MNALLSGLCAIIAIVVVAGTFLYAGYCALYAVFGEGEGGDAIGVTILCVVGFFGLMAVMAKVNAR